MKVTLLDKNNILWKVIDGKCIGKCSVYTFDLRTCWLEDVKENEIKEWLCGKDADYTKEYFKEEESFSKSLLKYYDAIC
jgi:hypothetical protein